MTDSYREGRRRLLPLAAGLITATATLGAASLFLSLSSSPDPRRVVDADLIEGRIDRVNERLESLNQSIVAETERVTAYFELERALRDSLLQRDPEAAVTMLERVAIQALAAAQAAAPRVDSLQQRVVTLERLLSEDPERALAIPMLRRDLADLDDQHRSEALALERQLDRLLGQAQWMVGILFALCLALLAVLFQGWRLPKPASRAPPPARQAPHSDAPQSEGDGSR